MWSKKNVVIFCAGAQAFHTLSHIVIKYAGMLPVKIFSIALTQQLNMWAIVINAVITLVLLWWAAQLKK